MFPELSATLDQIYGCSVLNNSESLGARVMLPESSIETPRASPRMTSAREFTDQTDGPTANANKDSETTRKRTNGIFDIRVNNRKTLCLNISINPNKKTPSTLCL